MKTMDNQLPRVITTRVDFPNRPQPHRVPGASNEVAVLIGRIPVAHSYRTPGGGILSRIDSAMDWFWFVLTATIYVGIPVVGLLFVLVERR